MDRLMPQDQLRAMLDQVAREIARREARICLSPVEPGGDGPVEGACTVYITFEHGMDGTLCLYANGAMFVRLAREVMQTDDLTPQDVADVAKEYLNVLGGHVLIRLFPEAKRPARFSVPVFCQGLYEPQSERRCIVLDYTGDKAEQVQLAYYTPHGVENDLKKDVSV